MEAESRRYMTALLWRSTDDPDLLELYRDQARQVLGDDYETAAMAYDLSDQAQVEFTARQQAQQTLRQQLDYLASYPGYLDTIHENAANMPTLSIFMDSSAGKFHAENVKKTDRDFPRSADVSLTLTETAGLENFLQDSVVSVCILLWMLVTVLRLTEERRSSLRYLVFGSPRGRTWLALRRVGILGLSAALGTALLMLTGLVTDSLLYGGLGDLSAAAQSSEIFQNFPYPLTLRQVLWAYCLLKALGMWLMGLLLWLILQLIHHLQTAMVARRRISGGGIQSVRLCAGQLCHRGPSVHQRVFLRRHGKDVSALSEYQPAGSGGKRSHAVYRPSAGAFGAGCGRSRGLCRTSPAHSRS